jgi:hypothetical protein
MSPRARHCRARASTCRQFQIVNIEPANGGKKLLPLFSAIEGATLIRCRRRIRGWLKRRRTRGMQGEALPTPSMGKYLFGGAGEGSFALGELFFNAASAGSASRGRQPSAMRRDMRPSHSPSRSCSGSWSSLGCGRAFRPIRRARRRVGGPHPWHSRAGGGAVHSIKSGCEQSQQTTYSISSSAATSSLSGTVRPSIRAL